MGSEFRGCDEMRTGRKKRLRRKARWNVGRRPRWFKLGWRVWVGKLDGFDEGDPVGIGDGEGIGAKEGNDIDGNIVGTALGSPVGRSVTDALG